MAEYHIKKFLINPNLDLFLTLYLFKILGKILFFVTRHTFRDYITIKNHDRYSSQLEKKSLQQSLQLIFFYESDVNENQRHIKTESMKVENLPKHMQVFNKRWTGVPPLWVRTFNLYKFVFVSLTVRLKDIRCKKKYYTIDLENISQWY